MCPLFIKHKNKDGAFVKDYCLALQIFNERNLGNPLDPLYFSAHFTRYLCIQL